MAKTKITTQTITNEKGKSKTQTIESKTRVKGEGLEKGANVLGFVMLILLVVALIRTLSNQDIPTVQSFLEMLTTVPDLSNTFNVFESITVNSGIEWLDGFLNIFTTLAGVLVYLFGGIVQIIMFALHIIGWAF